MIADQLAVLYAQEFEMSYKDFSKNGTHSTEELRRIAYIDVCRGPLMDAVSLIIRPVLLARAMAAQTVLENMLED